MHSTSQWLAFLAAIQLGIALKYGFVVLNSTSIACHTHWKYIARLHNIDASIFWIYASVDPMVSKLEGFHCT